MTYISVWKQRLGEIIHIHIRSDYFTRIWIAEIILVLALIRTYNTIIIVPASYNQLQIERIKHLKIT